MLDYWITSDHCDIRLCVRRIQSEFPFLKVAISKSLGASQIRSELRLQTKTLAKVVELSSSESWIGRRYTTAVVQSSVKTGVDKWKKCTKNGDGNSETHLEYDRTQKLLSVEVWTSLLAKHNRKYWQKTVCECGLFWMIKQQLLSTKFPIIHLELCTIIVLVREMIKVCSRLTSRARYKEFLMNVL